MTTFTLKRASIATGLYRPVRALHTRFHAAPRERHRDDVAFYRRWIPAGALCFDVGANIGDKSDAMLAAGLRVVEELVH